MLSARSSAALESLKNFNLPDLPSARLSVEAPEAPAQDFSLAAARVHDQVKNIHEGWYPDLVINGSHKHTWEQLKRARPKLTDAILDAMEAIDFEFGRYTRGESSWGTVQSKIHAYQGAWEALYKATFK